MLRAARAGDRGLARCAPAAASRRSRAGSARRLRERGLRVAVLRHPMPYGDLERQRVQRFATRADLDAARCTDRGARGVRAAPRGRQRRLRRRRLRGASSPRAEQEADVIVWDGGNNDFPFVRPDLHIVVVDALRPGAGRRLSPGRGRAAHGRRRRRQQGRRGRRRADVQARRRRGARRSTRARRSCAPPRRSGSTTPPPCAAGACSSSRTARPSRTAACRTAPATSRPSRPARRRSSIRARLRRAGDRARCSRSYPHIGPVLPGDRLRRRRSSRRCAATIERADADVVVSATPIDLAALVALDKPVVRARYEFADAGEPTLGALVDGFLARGGGRRPG